MAVPILKMVTIGLLPSPLKVLYYKLKGAKIGKNVSIGLFSILTCDKIEIGDGTKIGPLTFVSCKLLKLGKRVKINMLVAIETGIVEADNDVVIMEQVVIGGMLTPRSKIFIGKRVKIFPYCFLNPTEPIIIEEDVGIGGANYIFTHGSWQSILDGFPVSFGPVTIKKGVWFPWRVFVMPNVTVGEYATVGAGSVITKDIPSKSLAAGSPAKVLRTGSDYIKNFTIQEKSDIVKNILHEFSYFMNYMGFQSSIIEEISILKIDILRGGFKHSLFYSEKVIDVPESNIVVSLTKIEPEIIEKLIKEGKIWFDLECKRTFYRDSLMWEEMKNFFSRYGIRFEIES